MNFDDSIITRSKVQKEKTTSKKYARTILARQFAKNKLFRITKGKYIKNNDILIISTNLFTPAYLSFWSASYFNGFTEQIVNEMQVATTKRHKTINFENYTITFIKLSKKYFFGFKKIKQGNGFIFVADDEKLLIDAISKEKHLGNFDEIIKIIKNSKIKKNTIINYLNKINNKSLNKKIGYLLETYKKIDISKEVNYQDNNYVKLSNFLDGKIINKKWKVLI
ncbi:MAG: hypothetical protein PHX27_02395 [Candidatus ainarchaeum sp.]|nr:hypothetical protein [Candidatus ainarchaeum sp.]